MTTDNPPKITRELLSLFDLIVSGQASSEERTSFERRLLADPEMRRAYICYMDMEAELESRASEMGALSGQQMGAGRASSFPLAAVITLGFFLTAAIVFSLNWMNQRGGDSELDEVAIVTRLENAKFAGAFSGLKVGDRLRPMDRIKIREGLVQISFFSGAKVAIEAPAEVSLDSTMKLSLLVGKVSAYVPESARLFTIATKKYSVIDQGTQVSVEADAEGEIQTYVHEGAVRFNYLGSDGVTSRNQILSEFEKLTVNQHSETFLETGDFSDQFPPVVFPTLTALSVPNGYVSAVLEDRPVLYWRFESALGGIIPNEVGLPGSEAFEGRVDGKIELLGDRNNRAWIQRDPFEGVFVSTVTPVKDINKEGYSMELWVNPLEFRRATLASLVDPQAHPSSEHSTYFNHYHLSSLELMNVGSDYVHPANSFRFLHRWPPGTEGSVGSNIFEPGYLPGRWFHLVGVRTAVDASGHSEQRFYLNGELVVEKTLEKDRNDSDAYEFVIGRLDPARNERGLVGMIDEVALYARPLSSREIAAHYQLMTQRGN